MGAGETETAEDSRSPAAIAPQLPIGWLTAGIGLTTILIAAATTFTFFAQVGLRNLGWDHAEAGRYDIYWYLQAAMCTRILALGLLVAAAVALVRGARRLEAASAASEACAAELRDQKNQLNALNLRLFDEARIDPLTQLQTRLRLKEDLEEMWTDAERYGDHYCAVMCDVDRFKEYNDTYGHVAGDAVLRRVADSLLAGCRSGDRLYRYGGEEFLLLLRVSSVVDALVIADRHRAGIEALGIDHAANGDGVVTISMGLSPLWAGRFESAIDWIEQADAALYRAKRTGRNCIAAIGDERAVQAAA